MVKLRQDSKGNYSARKRLPDDVREEYGRRHGPRFEAKFFGACQRGSRMPLSRNFGSGMPKSRDASRPSAPSVTGKVLRSRNVRRARWLASGTNGSSRGILSATVRGGRMCATKFATKFKRRFEQAAGDDKWERSNPDKLWWEDEELRKEVRPVLADVGETAQFLAMKGLSLNAEGQALFLDWLYDDLSEVLRKIDRAMPKVTTATTSMLSVFRNLKALDRGETPQQLFEKWVSEKQPAQSTEESWSYVFWRYGGSTFTNAVPLQSRPRRRKSG